jgi:hypothetical protein
MQRGAAWRCDRETIVQRRKGPSLHALCSPLEGPARQAQRLSLPHRAAATDDGVAAAAAAAAAADCRRRRRLSPPPPMMVPPLSSHRNQPRPTLRSRQGAEREHCERVWPVRERHRPLKEGDVPASLITRLWQRPGNWPPRRKEAPENTHTCTPSTRHRTRRRPRQCTGERQGVYAYSYVREGASFLRPTHSVSDLSTAF